MRILRTHHVALSTSSFERLRTFYVETLGLPVVGGFAGHAIVFIQAGDTVIELIGEPPSLAPGAMPPASDAASRAVGDEVRGAGSAASAPDFDRRGWQHLAWEVADVDAAYAELSARGIPFRVPPEGFPEQAPTMRIAFFADPDGNLIELIQPLGPATRRSRRRLVAPGCGP